MSDEHCEECRNRGDIIDQLGESLGAEKSAREKAERERDDYKNGSAVEAHEADRLRKSMAAKDARIASLESNLIQLRAKCTTGDTQIAELKAALAEAERQIVRLSGPFNCPHGRLDWIAAKRSVSISGRYCWTYADNFIRPINMSLRQAIDAAIRAEAKERKSK